MARPTKKEENKKQLEQFNDEQLVEMARFMGVEFLEDMDRNERIELLINTKNTSVNIAKSAVVVEGKTLKCPVGYAVIKVHPKAGEGYGESSRVTLFMNVQGDVCVARRGVPVVVKEKFLNLLRTTKWTEYASNITSFEHFEAAQRNQSMDPLSNRKEQDSEVFEVYAHNPDYEALEAAERELVAKSEAYLKAKKQQEILKGTIFDRLAGV